MAERDYISTPVSDELNLKDTILGLSQDLKDLRTGKISPAEAHARAALAKQIWNGARIYLQAIQTIQKNAKTVQNSGGLTPLPSGPHDTPPPPKK